MKLNKFLALALSSVLTVGMLTGCSSDEEKETTDAGTGTEASEPIKVGMITDTGGVNDESFNQSAWRGLETIEKELGEDVVEVAYLESTKDADYVTHIDTFMDEEMDLIIGVGYKLEPAIAEAATVYPDQKFLLIDEVVKGGNPENVSSMMFDAHVASYLVGVIASEMSETGNIGFIGGMESELLETFRWGYVAGAEAVNPDVKVQAQYANSFTDQALGKSIAVQMYANDADVIYSAAGGVGIGAIEAAKENNKYAIGVDQDQYSLAPENMLTSAMKNIDTAVTETVRDLVNGEFAGGEVVNHTLQSGGVGIAPTTDKNVPAEVLAIVDEYIAKINSGEIVVPTTEEEYKELKAK